MRDIGREIASGERAEAELDSFISRRDAQRRKSEPERELEAAWVEAERRQEAHRRAERSGDPHLADAVYHVSTERGLRFVADSYLESRPQERKRWGEYAEARQEAEAHPIERVLFGAGAVGPIKPAELGG